MRVDENTDWMLCGFEIPFAAVPVPVGSVGWVWGALAVGRFQSLTCQSLETANKNKKDLSIMILLSIMKLPRRFVVHSVQNVISPGETRRDIK